MTAAMRCGDVVRHIPTGEEWLVAYADHDSGYMAAAGWPQERARISDCEIVERCSDDEHADHVKAWAARSTSDHRVRAVVRV